MSTRGSKVFLVVVGALLALACGGGSGGNGGGGGDTPQQPEAKLSIAYSALTAKVGDTVTLKAHLENSAGPVAWLVSGPGNLSATSGEEVAFEAKAAGDASVSAAAAGLTASVKIKCVPGPSPESTIDITGTILNRNGYPVANQGVVVVGMPDTVTASDGDGHFTIAGVTPPYDLAMIVDNVNRVFVYEGLTTATPIVYVFNQPDQTDVPPQLSVLHGLIASASPFPAPGKLAAIRFVSPDVDPALNFFSEASFEAIPGPYALSVAWRGPTTTTGTLVGLEVQTNLLGAPINYWYASQPNVTIQGGQPFLAGPPLTLMPAATANTEGTISLPPLYVLNAKSLALDLNDGVLLPIYFDVTSLAQPSFQYIAPDLAAARSQVCASAINTVPALPGFSITCVDALAPESSGTDIAILSAPQPFAPANGANAVTATTPLYWSEFTGGVHMVTVAPAVSSNPTYYIFTAATSTTIPDVSALGLSFSPGTYEWGVTGFAPFADLDAFASGIPPAAVFLKQPIIPPVPNSSVGFGKAWTFTH